MRLSHRAAGFGLAALLAATPALAQQKTLRIAMTAADVPTTTGAPNNGFEGVRFLGYPAFEGLVLWDLSRADRPATLRAGLAESWAQDPADPKTWIFKLRPGVKFHDGTDFNADAVIWNLDRYWKNDSPQFEPAGSGIARARTPIMAGYKKIDDMTVAISTTRVASYFPYMAVYILMTSPQSFEAGGRDWAKVAALPAAGTGPFKLSKFTPRVSAELSKNEGYWDKARIPKLDRILLLPMPEANTRAGRAALRPGGLDRGAAAGCDPQPEAGRLQRGDQQLPACLAVVLQTGGSTTPVQGCPGTPRRLNYCVDRAGLVSLLNDTAEPSVGWLKPSDPNFGKPEKRYGFDPAKGKALLAAAGFTPQKPLKFKVMISASGLGPDAAAADERIHAAEPEGGLRGRGRPSR